MAKWQHNHLLVSHSSQFSIICRVAESALCAIIQVIKEDVNERSMALQEHCPDPSVIMGVSHQIAWTSVRPFCLDVS